MVSRGSPAEERLRELWPNIREMLRPRKRILAVGFALSGKMAGATYNTADAKLLDYHIFALAGASRIGSDLQAIAVGATNLVATLIAMAVIDKLGRKKLLLTGTIGLAICLTIISVLFFTKQHLAWLVWLLMAYIACFAVSQGAVLWVYISEVFPNRVRSKGQSLGSSAHWIFNALISLVFPVMARSSGAYPFVFFAAMMVLDFFLVLFYYPETSGISLEQMQHKLGID